MNKNRVEAFSDSVFAIATTLLILDLKPIRLPNLLSDPSLAHAFAPIAPHILIYVITFAVLSVLWLHHHFLFHLVVEKVDRELNLFNLGYLLFTVFVPFSASLLAENYMSQPAAMIYGVNLFFIVSFLLAMYRYVHHHRGMLKDLPTRTRNQLRFRVWLSLSSYMIGIVSAVIYVPVSLFFYVLPVFFNIVPGSVNFTEKLFKLHLD